MTKLNYVTVNTEKELEELLASLANLNKFVFDLESNSLETHKESTEIVGIGFCWSPAEAFYIPFNGNLDKELILKGIKEILENDSIGKIGHNIKYDSRLLNRYNINVTNIIFDTMVASYCLYGDRTRHNLDDLVLHHFNHVKIRTKSVIPKKSKTLQEPSMFDTEVEKVKTYCCEDVDYTYQLYTLLKYLLELPVNAVAKKIFYEIDMPLVTTLLKVECNGAKLSDSKLEELRKFVGDEIETLQKEINEIAGRELTLTKPADISACLYTELKIDEKLGIAIPKTKTGMSTAAATLEMMAAEPIVEKILEYKKLTKLMSTYILPLPTYVSEITDCIHTSYGQTMTATARLNSSSPNLQNIPARTKVGKKIREAFVSRFPGGKILAADYSQAELRILAHMGKEEVFLKAYKIDADVHTAVASEVVYEKKFEEVTEDERRTCKTVNFGLLYGMRAKKLAATLGIDLSVSYKIMEKYMDKMKGLKTFLDNSRTFLKENGYTENYFGRRRYIPKIYSDDQLDQWGAEREGANSIIQGTNADIIRIAMNRIQAMLEDGNYRSKMILQVHDELVFDIHPDEFFLKEKIKDIMEHIVEFDVTMKADGKFGESWADAH